MAEMAIFEKCWLDTFETKTNLFFFQIVPSCEGFDFPSNAVGRLMIWHSGYDAWKFDWIRLVFSDDTYVQCNGGSYIDNETSLIVPCS